MKKNLQPLRAFLHALRADELEPGQREAAEKAVRKLIRGLEAEDLEASPGGARRPRPSLRQEAVSFKAAGTEESSPETLLLT